MSAQVKGGDKPSELPLVSRALTIRQALCKVFTCMISINHCNSPALKKQKNKKPFFFFLQMRKLGHRENNFPSQHSWEMACVLLLSCCSRVQLFVTPWTVTHRAPLSMGFSRQKYWSGLPCPPPGDLPDPRIELVSLKSPPWTGAFCPPGKPWEMAKVGFEPKIVS